MKLLLCSIFALFLTDSVNAQNGQYISPYKVKAEQCDDAMKTNSALNPIKDKVAFDLDRQTVAMLADKSKPTAKEKVVILAWGKEIQECQKLWQAYLDDRNITGALRNVENAYDRANQYLLADLYGGKLTYGQFAALRDDIRVEAVKMSSNVMANQKKQEDEAEYRNRLLAAQEMQARAARTNAIAAENAQSTNMIIQGARLLNSTVTPPPPAVTPSNIRCIQQGVFTNCTSF